MVSWQIYNDQIKKGIALYNYDANGQEHHLNLLFGDNVQILQHTIDWYYGYKWTNPKVCGIFPKCFVQLTDDSATQFPGLSESLLDWIRPLHKAFVNGDDGPYASAIKYVDDIIKEKKKVISKRMSSQEFKETHKRICTLLSQGKKQLCLPVEIRDQDLRPVDPLKMACVDLYRAHIKTMDDAKAALFQKSLGKEIFSMEVHLTSIHAPNGQTSEIMLVLFLLRRVHNASSNPFVRMSDNFTCHLKADENPSASVSNSNFPCDHTVVFTDLESINAEDKLYLIFQLTRIKTVTTKKSQTTVDSQRPFGVGFLDVTSSYQNARDLQAASIPFHAWCNNDESLDSFQSRLITSNAARPQDKSQQICIRLIKFVSANYQQCVEYTQNQGIKILRKYGFPSEVNPGLHRNDFYVTLVSALLKKDNIVSRSENVEVEISVHYKNGKIVDPGKTDCFPYRSVVYSQGDRPKWVELYKIALDKMPNISDEPLHLRFLIKHREGKFSVSYLELRENGTEEHFLKDDDYYLHIYKMDLKDIEKGAYLKKPSKNENDSGCSVNSSSSNFLSALTNSSLPNRGLLHVKTLLCSTEHTNNKYVYQLLHWKMYIDEIVSLMQRKFYLHEHVPDCELKKFAERIMNMLLELQSTAVNGEDYHIATHNIDEIGKAGIKSLVRCFQTLLTIPGYRDMLQKHFSTFEKWSNLHNHLLTLLVDELSDPTMPFNTFSNTFSKIGWFFKIIVRSKELHDVQLQDAPGNVKAAEHETFCLNVDKLLCAISNVTTTSKNPVQPGVLFKHIGEIIDDLVKVYDTRRLTHHLIDLVRSCADSKESPKENILQEIINSTLFSDAECRAELLQPVTSSLIRFFTLNIEKELSNQDTVNSAYVSRWCDILLAFYERHATLWKQAQIVCIMDTETSNAETSDGYYGDTKQEMESLLIEHDLLRCMVQLLVRSIKRGEQEVKKTGSLETIVGSITTVVLGILQQIPPEFWSTYLLPKSCVDWNKPRMVKEEDVYDNKEHEEQENKICFCWCNICYGLDTIDERDVLTELLTLIRNICSKPVYPGPTDKGKIQPWTDMLLLQSYQIYISLFNIFTAVIKVAYLETPMIHRGIEISSLAPVNSTFARPIITLFRECLEEFIVQPVLHLESDTLPHSNRSRYKDLCPQDMRWYACCLFQELWQSLGNYRDKYLEDFVAPVIKIATVPLSNVRSTAVNILFDMMTLDMALVEHCMVTAMDRVMEEVEPSFTPEIIRLMTRAAAWHPKQLTLVRMIGKQMRLLNEYHEYSDNDSRINSMLAINNLRIFYMGINRDDMCSRYLYKLVWLHEQCGNKTEMGCTLRIISESLEWSKEAADVSYVLPKYSGYTVKQDLKEKLLLDSLDCFAYNDWEMANQICSELETFYKMTSPNYAKLSLILGRSSDLYGKISKREPRPQHKYFLIRYYGTNYPSFIAHTTDAAATTCIASSEEQRRRSEDNGESAPLSPCSANDEDGNVNCFSFIYRGSGFLRDVMDMTLGQFPDAKCINKPLKEPLPPGEKRILIGGVDPVMQLPEYLINKTIDRTIRQYYENNETTRFTFKRNLNRTENVTEMCVEVSECNIQQNQPSLLPLVPVCRVIKQTHGPYESAVSSILKSYKDLSDALEDYNDPSTKADSKEISGLLRGIIDAPVQGGLTRYLDLNDDRDDSPDNLSDAIRKLLEVTFLSLNTCTDIDHGLRSHLITKFGELSGELSVGFGFSVQDLDINTIGNTPPTTETPRVFTKCDKNSQQSTSRAMSFSSAIGRRNSDVSLMLNSFPRRRPTLIESQLDIQRKSAEPIIEQSESNLQSPVTPGFRQSQGGSCSPMDTESADLLDSSPPTLPPLPSRK